MKYLVACISLVTAFQIQAADLFSLDGKVYTTNNLPAGAADMYKDLEVRALAAKRRFLDESVFELKVAELMQTTGKSKEKVLSELVKVEKPSDKEIRAFYNQNKDKIPYPLEKIKDDVERHLIQSKETEARSKAIENIKKSGGFRDLTKSLESFSKGALFEFNKSSYSYADLPQSIKAQIFDFDMNIARQLRNISEEALLSIHVDALAKKQKKTPDEVRAGLLKVDEPTDKELKDFYEKNKSSIPAPYEEVKERIRPYLKQMEEGKKREQILKKIQNTQKFVNLVQDPEPPVLNIPVEGFASKGNPKAQVVLVEFADYQCPHCKHAFEAFSKVFPEFKDQIQFVYIDYPINPSGISRKVAHGAYCARQQGKFWPFHEMAFEQQKSLSADSPKVFAKKLGLDLKKFEGCLTASETITLVNRGKELGDELGISGTPSIYLNGRRATFNSHDVNSIRQGIKAAIKVSSKKAS